MELLKDVLRKMVQLTLISLVLLVIGLQLYHFSGGSFEPQAGEQSARTSQSTHIAPAASSVIIPNSVPQSPRADAESVGLVNVASNESVSDPQEAVAPSAGANDAESHKDAEHEVAGSKLDLMTMKEIRAQLSPRRFATLATEIGARIRQIPVAESSQFRSGQLLVAFDCSIQKAQLQRAHADMVAASKTLAANEQLDKFNSIGKIELDTSFSVLQKAKAEVAIAEASLKKCDIHAPYNGRVVELKVREQQYVQPGQPLLDILDDSQLELEFIVPSRWLAWLKPGLPFTVKIDETGKSYQAKFTRIGARVDPASMSVKVAGQIEGQHSELMAGMSGVIDARPGESPRPASQQRRPSGVRAERTATEL